LYINGFICVCGFVFLFVACQELENKGGHAFKQRTGRELPSCREMYTQTAGPEQQEKNTSTHTQYFSLPAYLSLPTSLPLSLYLSLSLSLSLPLLCSPAVVVVMKREQTGEGGALERRRGRVCAVH
ncbi:hypothetical protein COCON_G00186620, partial [Conger conger]